MRRLILLVVVAVMMAWPARAFGQTTFVITDTSRATWTPSADNNTTFGTPAVPVLTNYRADLWLKSAVVFTGTPPAPVLPTTPPIFTFDWGKPAVVAGAQTSPVLKPLLQPNTEYVMFLRAEGPGGVSPASAGTVPFGFPAAPRTVASPVTFTP